MVDASWLEISLVVDGEMAEAVAEVFTRFVPNGVAIESTSIAPDPEGEGRVQGPLRVCGYLPVNDRLEETRQRLEEALWYLGRIRHLPAPQYQQVQENDWAEAWKKHYHPLPIGKKLIVVPAWLESPSQDRIPIRMDPGMAFGTGTHPTTQLCLEIVEERVRPGDTVIDVGCGSGILSIAAIKLGARRALAVDIDPLAIPVVQENARVNGVGGSIVTGVGSVDKIQGGSFDIQHADLVLANILAPVLARLLNEGMADLLAPRGLLVLSGILDEQWEGKKEPSPLREAVYAHGLRLVEKRRSGDWIAAVVGRP